MIPEPRATRLHDPDTVKVRVSSGCRAQTAAVIMSALFRKQLAEGIRNYTHGDSSFDVSHPYKRGCLPGTVKTRLHMAQGPALCSLFAG